MSPDQIKNALGSDDLEQLVATTGLDIDELSGRISEKLSTAIDKMTPDGAVPEGGFSLDSLTKMFGS